MRNIICLFAVIAIMMSCSQPVEVVEANGFSPRGNEIKMGSQESVNLMIEFDKFWKAKDYDSMKMQTDRLMNPERKLPFPQFNFLLNMEHYNDSGAYCNQLHEIALSNINN